MGSSSVGYEYPLPKTKNSLDDNIAQVNENPNSLGFKSWVDKTKLNGKYFQKFFHEVV